MAPAVISGTKGEACAWLGIAWGRLMPSESWTTALGLVAAALTWLSYIPQVRKAFPRDANEDISLKMLIALFSGLALWIVYGLMRSDSVIIIANGIGAALVGDLTGLFWTKLCEKLSLERSFGHAVEEV